MHWDTAFTVTNAQTTMSKYRLAKEVLSFLEDFEAEQPAYAEYTAADFAAWLAQRTGTPTAFESVEAAAPQGLQQLGDAVENQLARLLVSMYKYAKGYFKTVLHDTPLQTIEEFTYLAILLGEGSMPKTELVNRGLDGKTSGIEIINRLLRQGFVQQYENTADKRSQLIEITPAGKGMFFSILQPIHSVSHLVSGNLSPQERLQLLYLLRKLDHLHRDIYRNDRGEAIETITDKYLN